MKNIFIIIAITIFIIAVFGCTSGDGEIKKDFTGGVFKGPFLVGSTVTIYPLDSDLNQIGESYSGDIVSDDGTYDISGLRIVGPVELVAEGYYFDELTGQITGDRIILRTITEDTGTININLLTALEYDYVKTLYNVGTHTLTEAKESALDLIFNAFGFVKKQTGSELININTENGAELLAISSLFLYGKTTAQTQELLTEMRVDFSDGNIDISGLVASAKNIDAPGIQGRLQNYYDGKSLPVQVPDFTAVIISLLPIEEEIVSDVDNYVKLSSTDTIQLTAGFGHFDGFTIPAGTTLTFTMDTPAGENYVRFFEVMPNGFTISNENKIATVSGPGYFKLDFSVAYPPTPYNFSITVDINGIENIVNYRVN